MSAMRSEKDMISSMRKKGNHHAPENRHSIGEGLRCRREAEKIASGNEGREYDGGVFGAAEGNCFTTFAKRN